MNDDNQAVVDEAPAQVADKVEPQTSEADVQVTNEAPEATQANTEEAQSVNTTDKVEEKLYAGTFKSPEDMEKAYQELRSKATKDSMEKAELSRILNEAFTVQEPVAQPVANVDDSYIDEPDPVNQEIETLKRNQAVTMFVMNHQDANPEAMQQVLTTDPLVKQISGHEAKLEYAYLRSQSMTQQKAIAEATKTGAQAATAKLAEKQVAQVESAQQSTAQVDETADLKQRMQTGTLTEREAARREYIKKNLVNL